MSRSDGFVIEWNAHQVLQAAVLSQSPLSPVKELPLESFDEIKC